MDVILTAMQKAAQSWRSEAEARRKISRTDAVADTLDYCAGELAARLRDAQAAVEEQTVEQRARAEGVTAQTVRTWIRHGRIPARETPKGYMIPKDAPLLARKSA